MPDFMVSCSCSTLKGVLRNCSSASGTRIICYCKDCQAGAHALGAERLLNPQGGTDIVQTLPTRLEITEGAEHLSCLRLSPKGLLRWYASCCNTPMFNTLGTNRLRFLGVLSHAIEKGPEIAFGPVIAVANVQGAGSVEAGLEEYGRTRALFHILSRHLAALLSRKKSATFFSPDGTPTAVPRVLTLEERRAATPV